MPSPTKCYSAMKPRPSQNGEEFSIQTAQKTNIKKIAVSHCNTNLIELNIGKLPYTHERVLQGPGKA